MHRIAVTTRHRHQIDFQRIAHAALQRSHELVPAMLKHGHRRGDEWLATNPTRADRKVGSFRINLRTGLWGDFAVGMTGGDLISLLAYLENRSQTDAALILADRLSTLPYGGPDER